MEGSAGSCAPLNGTWSAALQFIVVLHKSSIIPQMLDKGGNM